MKKDVGYKMVTRQLVTKCLKNREEQLTINNINKMFNENTSTNKPVYLVSKDVFAFHYTEV